MSFFQVKNTHKKTLSEILFSSSSLKVSSKRVQKVKMVLNSSVKRNVSTKNSEEVEDRERGEGRIIMQVCIYQRGSLVLILMLKKVVLF